MICLIALWCFFLACRAVDITTSGAEEDGQGNCLQLVTCTTGPIQGNLFWYAAFANGSELRFARNDGGNAERNPPYNELTLTGVTNYYTEVSRRLINGDLFTEFNSTLAFNVFYWLQYNSNISCGSSSTNSSKITPPAPQIVDDEVSYQLFEIKNSTRDILVCNGSDIPLNFMVGSCSLNGTSNILQWNINGTIIANYDYEMNFLRNVSGNYNNYEVIVIYFEQRNDKLNVVSHLQVTPNLTPNTIVSCGSNIFLSNIWRIPIGFNITSNSNLDVIASSCLETVTCISNIDGTCEVYIGRSRNDLMSRSSISGSTNTSLSTSSLLLDWRVDVFFFATFNTTESFFVEGNFSIKGDVKLSSRNTALIAIGVTFAILSLLLLPCLILCVLIFREEKEILQILLLGMFITSVVGMISGGIFWIVTAAIVAPQEDTCDTKWQSQRDDLIQANSIFSIICLVVAVFTYVTQTVCFFKIAEDD